jgi:predicted hotdog family 3-hydroxylacyl-ACP dehydratase
MQNRDDLCALLPHSGNMCLLDKLLDWDEGAVVCTALSHRDRDNPLRRDGHLAAIHAIEYAGQAAALHGALSSRDVATGCSVLAAVNDVELAQDRLDQLPAPLHISAWRELVLGHGAIYRFLVECGGLPVAQGRLTVVGGVPPT